jgi:hypothetical protein
VAGELATSTKSLRHVNEENQHEETKDEHQWRHPQIIAGFEPEANWNRPYPLTVHR